MKLNGTLQLVVYADGYTLLCYSINITMKNTEASLLISKETGLEVIAEKTRYIFMYREQNKVKNKKK